MTQFNDKKTFLARIVELVNTNTAGEISAIDVQDAFSETFDTLVLRHGSLSRVRLQFNRNANTITLQTQDNTGTWSDAGVVPVDTFIKWQQYFTKTEANTRFYTKSEADNMFAHTSNVHSIEDLIYTQAFRQAFANRVGRYRNTSSSTFFVDSELMWAYPKVNFNPTYQGSQTEDFDFGKLFGRWITLDSEINSESFPLKLDIKSRISGALSFTFVLLEVTHKPATIQFKDTNTNLLGQKNINVDVGWHSLIFLQAGNGRIFIVHKPFIDKLLLDAYLERNLIQRIDLGTYLPENLDLNFSASQNTSNLRLSYIDSQDDDYFTSTTIEDTAYIRDNYPKLNASPYSLIGRGESTSGWTEIVVTSAIHFGTPTRIALKPQGNTPIRTMDLLSVPSAPKVYYVWNQGSQAVIITNDNFPNGFLRVGPFQVWLFNTQLAPGATEWIVSNRTAIEEIDLDTRLREKINQSGGGGTDTTQLPFASQNRISDLSAFEDFTLANNISLDEKHSVALVQPKGNPITRSTIQLQDIGRQYRIWNKGTTAVNLVNNKFPYHDDILTIQPARVYLFQYNTANKRWRITQLSTFNYEDLSNELKGQSAFLSAGRLMRYWNAYGRMPEFTGDNTAWDTISVNQFATHTVEAAQHPTIPLIGARTTEYHAFRQGSNFSVRTEVFFSLTDSNVSTLFVWNQFSDHFLEVGFLSEDGHEMTNIGEIFGTDARTSPTVLEPGEMRMFFVHRKDITAQGNLTRQLDPTKTLARNPFKPTPRFYGQGTIDTFNIKTGAITQSKLADSERRRYAQLFCNGIKLNAGGNPVVVTAREWILISGTWKLPDTLPTQSLMRVSTYGRHYSMETTYNVGISANEDNSIWTYYDPLHIGGEQWSYGWKPEGNTDFVFIIRARDFAKITAQDPTNKKFSIYIEDLGVPNGIRLTSITGVFFGGATVSDRVATVPSKTDITNILDISQSTFNL